MRLGKLCAELTIVNQIEPGEVQLSSINPEDSLPGWEHVLRQFQCFPRQVGFRQIGAVQDATQTTAKEIGGIAEIMTSVTAITASVAAAVEQQQATTADIARSITQAASSAQEVSQNVAGLTAGAQETGEASRSVQEAARALSRQSDAMRDDVTTFLDAVRAA